MSSRRGQSASTCWDVRGVVARIYLCTVLGSSRARKLTSHTSITMEIVSRTTSRVIAIRLSSTIEVDRTNWSNNWREQSSCGGGTTAAACRNKLTVITALRESVVEKAGWTIECSRETSSTSVELRAASIAEGSLTFSVVSAPSFRWKGRRRHRLNGDRRGSCWEHTVLQVSRKNSKFF